MNTNIIFTITITNHYLLELLQTAHLSADLAEEVRGLVRGAAPRALPGAAGAGSREASAGVPPGAYGSRCRRRQRQRETPAGGRGRGRGRGERSRPPGRRRAPAKKPRRGAGRGPHGSSPGRGVQRDDGRLKAPCTPCNPPVITPIRGEPRLRRPLAASRGGSALRQGHNLLRSAVTSRA